MDKAREHKLMALLSDDPSLILLIKPKYITTNMWKICIEKEPSLYQYMKEPMEELCLYALEEDGSNLKYFKDMNIHITNKMAWVAVTSYPPAILDLPDYALNNAIMEKAFDLDPTLMIHFDDVREEYIMEKVKEYPGVIRWVRNQTEDILSEAIIRDPNACVHVREYTPRLESLVKRLYPGLASMMDVFRDDYKKARDNNGESGETN